MKFVYKSLATISLALKPNMCQNVPKLVAGERSLLTAVVNLWNAHTFFGEESTEPLGLQGRLMAFLGGVRGSSLTG